MRFELIVGNPPYQADTGSTAKAVYNLFIDMALYLCDRVVFIVPSRWMSDKPNGLESTWLNMMRTRNDFVKIVDFADSSYCFKDVSISGGVCYFLINKRYHGNVDVKYIDKNGDCSERKGVLAYNGVVIRNQRLLKIVTKVSKLGEVGLDSIIGTSRQFSPNDSYFNTNWSGFSNIKDSVNYIRYFTSSRVTDGEAYVSEKDLPDGALGLVKEYKLFVPITGPTNNEIVKIPFIGGKNSCCSRTYTVVHGDAVNNEKKALNCIKYWKTKFLRVLVSAVKTTQHATRQVYRFVPLQDFSDESVIDWDRTVDEIDMQLYKKYRLSDNEIEYIESTIKALE